MRERYSEGEVTLVAGLALVNDLSNPPSHSTSTADPHARPLLEVRKVIVLIVPIGVLVCALATARTRRAHMRAAAARIAASCSQI